MYAIGSPSGHLMTLDAVLASKLVEALAAVDLRVSLEALCSKLGAPIPPMPELGRGERRFY